MSSSSPIGRLPKPRLDDQPQDIMNLIMKNMKTAEAGMMSRASNSMSNAFKSFRDPLLEQRRQWSLLFDDLGESPADFSKNETRLREYGAATIEFTEEESAAWTAAYNSLADPPPPLSEERRAELIKELLPRYSEKYNTESEEYYGEEGYGRFFNNALDLDQGSNPIVPINLTTIAVVDSDFLTCLRLFAVDGDRYLRDPRSLVSEYYQQNIVELAMDSYMGNTFWDRFLTYHTLDTPVKALTDERYHYGTQGLRGTPRGLLLALLFIRGVAIEGGTGPDARYGATLGKMTLTSPYAVTDLYTHPALVRALILSGSNSDVIFPTTQVGDITVSSGNLFQRFLERVALEGPEKYENRSDDSDIRYRRAVELMRPLAKRFSMSFRELVQGYRVPVAAALRDGASSRSALDLHESCIEPIEKRLQELSTILLFKMTRRTRYQFSFDYYLFVHSLCPTLIELYQNGYLTNSLWYTLSSIAKVYRPNIEFDPEDPSLRW